MTDNALTAAFESADLEPFHHADHVHMAFLYFSRYPAPEAIARFSSSLAQFAVAKGKLGLYHETITWAYLLLTRERMSRAGGHPTWEAFAAANPDLLNWKENLLNKYYREETLASDLARATFLMPDRICG
jgi:hypothetical protein